MLSNIPLDFFGVVVGTGTLDDEGRLSIDTMEPSELGVSIADLLIEGVYTTLTIVPRGLPIPPQPPAPTTEEPQPDPETEVTPS